MLLLKILSLALVWPNLHALMPSDVMDIREAQRAQARREEFQREVEDNKDMCQIQRPHLACEHAARMKWETAVYYEQKDDVNAQYLGEMDKIRKDFIESTKRTDCSTLEGSTSTYVVPGPSRVVTSGGFLGFFAKTSIENSSSIHSSSSPSSQICNTHYFEYSTPLQIMAGSLYEREIAQCREKFKVCYAQSNGGEKAVREMLEVSDRELGLMGDNK